MTLRELISTGITRSNRWSVHKSHKDCTWSIPICVICVYHVIRVSVGGVCCFLIRQLELSKGRKKGQRSSDVQLVGLYKHDVQTCDRGDNTGGVDDGSTGSGASPILL